MTTALEKRGAPAWLVAGLVMLGILLGVALLTACAVELVAQASPASDPSIGIPDLIPSAAAAFYAAGSVYLTGHLVKGVGAADGWYQRTVTPKLKPVQPLIATAASLGLAVLGTKTGVTGLDHLGDALVQAPVATLLAIALREGAVAIQKSRTPSRSRGGF